MTTYLKKGNEAYLRLMGRRFLVEVLAVANDTISISFPGGNYPIEGLGVTLEFHEPNGVVSYHTQVIAGPRGEGEGMVLQRAVSVTRMQHRRAWRVPVNVKMSLRKRGQRLPRKVLVIDISAEGVLIETNAPLAFEDLTDLRLTLPKLPVHVVAARVVRLEPADPARKQGPRFALLFVDVAPETRRLLTYYVWSQLRRRHPDEMMARFPGVSKRKELAKRLKKAKKSDSQGPFK